MNEVRPFTLRFPPIGTMVKLPLRTQQAIPRCISGVQTDMVRAFGPRFSIVTVVRVLVENSLQMAQYYREQIRKSGYTKFEVATHYWSGSHALLFNAYEDYSVNGSLAVTGNTKIPPGDSISQGDKDQWFSAW